VCSIDSPRLVRGGPKAKIPLAHKIARHDVVALLGVLVALVHLRYLTRLFRVGDLVYAQAVHPQVLGAGGDHQLLGF
jgi:hypothetical protein